jgi:hypothetical protein
LSQELEKSLLVNQILRNEITRLSSLLLIQQYNNNNNNNGGSGSKTWTNITPGSAAALLSPEAAAIMAANHSPTVSPTKGNRSRSASHSGLPSSSSASSVPVPAPVVLPSSSSFSSGAVVVPLSPIQEDHRQQSQQPQFFSSSTQSHSLLQNNTMDWKHTSMDITNFHDENDLLEFQREKERDEEEANQRRKEEEQRNDEKMSGVDLIYPSLSLDSSLPLDPVSVVPTVTSSNSSSSANNNNHSRPLPVPPLPPQQQEQDPNSSDPSLPLHQDSTESFGSITESW